MAPKPLSSFEVLGQLDGFQFTFGKERSGIKRKYRNVGPYNWKKRSIFFELPYWETLLLRHNLDVMHIGRYVSDMLIGTLLNIDGKPKTLLKLDLT